MEGFQKAIRSGITNPTKLQSSSFNSGATGSYSYSSSDPTALLLTAPPRSNPVSGISWRHLFVLGIFCMVMILLSCRRAVTLLTCSKLCAFSFFAGIIVGYTLKRRVRRWAAKLLRRIKDD